MSYFWAVRDYDLSFSDFRDVLFFEDYFLASLNCTG